MKDRLKAARMAATTVGLSLCAVLFFTGVASAQDGEDSALLAAEQERINTVSEAEMQAARSNPPNYQDVLYAFYDADYEYVECVEERRSAVLDEMWRRGAPLEAALSDIGLAFRRCPGFEQVWARMYFAGYDSPEDWIYVDLQAAKAAALTQAEIELDEARSLYELFRDALSELRSLDRIERDARIKARDKLLSEREVMALMLPRTALPDDAREMVEGNAELLAAMLPADVVEKLKAAKEVAAKGRDPQRLADYMVRNAR